MPILNANTQFLLFQLLVIASFFLSQEVVVADECDKCRNLQRKSRTSKRNCPRKCRLQQNKRRFELSVNCNQACCVEICKRSRQVCTTLGYCEATDPPSAAPTAAPGNTCELRDTCVACLVQGCFYQNGNGDQSCSNCRARKAACGPTNETSPCFNLSARTCQANLENGCELS